MIFVRHDQNGWTAAMFAKSANHTDTLYIIENCVAKTDVSQIVSAFDETFIIIAMEMEMEMEPWRLGLGKCIVMGIKYGTQNCE